MKTSFKMQDQARSNEIGNSQHPENGHHSSFGDDDPEAALVRGILSNKTTTMKTILYYHTCHPKPYCLGKGQEYFKDCPVHQCYATNDSTFLPSIADFDAIYFPLLDIRHMVNLTWIRSWKMKRSPHQRFILFHRESPGLAYPDRFKRLNGKI